MKPGELVFLGLFVGVIAAAIYLVIRLTGGLSL